MFLRQSCVYMFTQVIYVHIYIHVTHRHDGIQCANDQHESFLSRHPGSFEIRGGKAWWSSHPRVCLRQHGLLHVRCCTLIHEAEKAKKRMLCVRACVSV